MKLALDAMGGDYAPQEIVLGGLDALNQHDFLEKIYFRPIIITFLSCFLVGNQYLCMLCVEYPYCWWPFWPF